MVVRGSFRSQRGAGLLWALFAAALLGWGCSSEITDDDIEKWTRNEVGIQRITEVVADREVSLDIKRRAVVRVVTSGQATRVRALVDKAPDRAMLAAAVADDLVVRLDSENDAVRAKDGLLLLLRYLPEDKQETVRKRIAEWAFEGLDDGSTTAQIKKQVEHRILPAQIEELGRHGARGAALLLSRGFAVDKMFGLLTSFQSPETDKVTLDALIKLQSIPEVQLNGDHIERVGSIQSADAVVYLLRIYDTTEDRDLAADAFNKASALLKNDNVAREREKILPHLHTYLEGKNPDDRWFAASSIVRLGGADALTRTLTRLRDDNVYDTGTHDPLESVLRFCETAVATLEPSPATDLLEVARTGANRVQKATALLCLKAVGGQAALDGLTGLVEDTTDIANFVGAQITLGQLAQNAAAGIRLIEKHQAAAQAGTLKPDELRRKRVITLLTVDKMGDELGPEVDRIFQAEQRSGAGAPQ